MTVSEAITKSGITPSASYTGIETANDFVLAFQIESTQTKESQWIVCADHVKEHSGSLNATTEDSQYIRTGNVTEKTGPVVGVKVVSDADDVLVINDAGVIIRMAVSGISTYGRTAQGVKIMNLEEGVKVISFARTDHEEEEAEESSEEPNDQQEG